MDLAKMENDLKKAVNSWKHYKKFCKDKENFYHVWTQRTKKKKRKISAPVPKLVAVHEKIKNILNELPLPNCITGFAPGTSVKINATTHVDKPIVSSYDIVDFFHNTTEEMVARELGKLFKSKKLCDKIAAISTFRGGLPQGSKVSPVLANIVFMPVDKKLSDLAAMNEGVYSRYADDFTISSTDIGIHQLQRYIENLVEDYGFQVNPKKTRHLTQRRRQVVTGIVVNKKPQPNKNYRYNLKAQLHNLAVKNVKISKERMRSLKGMCQWVNEFNPNFVEKFLKPNLELIKTRR